MRTPAAACYSAGMAIDADEREALRMLADSPQGSTESIMLAHGFAIGMLRDLVRNGLATADRRVTPTARRLIVVKVADDHGRQRVAVCHIRLSRPSSGTRGGAQHHGGAR
jgi:hypothetical protein